MSIIYYPNRVDVTFEEIVDGPGKSPTVDISVEGSTGTRILKCAWADRNTLLEQVLGVELIKPVNPNPGNDDDNFPPVLYYNNFFAPEDDEADVYIFDSQQMPGYPGLFASSIKIEPFSNSTGKDANNAATYEFALLTITYRSRSYDFPGEDGGAPDDPETVLLTENLQPAAEFLTLNASGLKWGTTVSSPTSPERTVGAADAPQHIVRMTEWIVTIHKVPAIPRIFTTIPGIINSLPIISRTTGLRYAERTLLCGNPTSSRRWTSQGLELWDITLRFIHRPQADWNKFPDTGGGADTDSGLKWNYIFDANDNVILPYTIAIFKAIFGPIFFYGNV
jgi:hypothetical protein